MLTHVYLSPHLDDAALSCGGMIHRQARAGERAIGVTVCAGDPPPGPRGDVFAYFADYPYAAWEPEFVAEAPGRALVPEIIPLVEADLAAKVNAIAAYASQISTFWGGLAEMEAAVRAFAERTWRSA